MGRGGLEPPTHAFSVRLSACTLLHKNDLQASPVPTTGLVQPRAGQGNTRATRDTRSLKLQSLSLQRFTNADTGRPSAKGVALF